MRALLSIVSCVGCRCRSAAHFHRNWKRASKLAAQQFAVLGVVLYFVQNPFVREPLGEALGTAADCRQIDKNHDREPHGTDRVGIHKTYAEKSIERVIVESSDLRFAQASIAFGPHPDRRPSCQNWEITDDGDQATCLVIRANRDRLKRPGISLNNKTGVTRREKGDLFAVVLDANDEGGALFAIGVGGCQHAAFHGCKEDWTLHSGKRFSGDVGTDARGAGLNASKDQRRNDSGQAKSAYAYLHPSSFCHAPLLAQISLLVLAAFVAVWLVWEGIWQLIALRWLGASRVCVGLLTFSGGIALAVYTGECMWRETITQSIPRADAQENERQPRSNDKRMLQRSHLLGPSDRQEEEHTEATLKREVRHG